MKRKIEGKDGRNVEEEMEGGWGKEERKICGKMKREREGWRERRGGNGVEDIEEGWGEMWRKMEGEKRGKMEGEKRGRWRGR